MGWDVIVLGVGAMGAAACLSLAERGAKVLGLERFTVPHARGSSHGQSRIFRRAYAEGSDYVPLAIRAEARWEAIGEAIGRPILHRTGLVYYGPPESSLLASVEASARSYGIPLVALTAEEARARFPMYRAPEGDRALLEPEAGYVEAEAGVAAMAARARALGAELREGEAALGWRVVGGRVEVRSERGRYKAGALVLTAGAWTGPLLESLELPLEVRRVPLFWYPDEAGAHGPERAPCFFFDLPEGPIYGFPSLAPWGVKVAEHLPRELVADPLALDRARHPEDHAALDRARARVLPHLGAAPSHFAVCMYTMSPDEGFLLDRHPEHPEVCFAAGFSGHGFKFAPAIGEALADLALEGRSALPIGFLSLERFAPLGSGPGSGSR